MDKHRGLNKTGAGSVAQTGTRSSTGRRQINTSKANLYAHLGAIVRAIPAANFHEVMLKELSEFVDWRGRVVARYSTNTLPELVFDEGIDHSNFQLYLDGYYRLDPYYALCESGPVGGVYTWERDFPETADNAYATAYLPLAGWRDDVGVFFPGLGTESIGLFWEKTKQVRKSELDVLEQLYPLLRDMHDTHLLVVLGQLATRTRHDDPISMPYLITDRDNNVIYQSDSWPEQLAELGDVPNSSSTNRRRKHRCADGSQLIVERLPKSFSNAPEGWVCVSELPSQIRPPTTMQSALSEFSSIPVTQRESQILGLILSGHSNANISTTLGISVGAIKNHRVRLYRKFNVTTERALMHLFVQHLTDLEAEP